MFFRTVIGLVWKVSLLALLAGGAWTAWELRPPPKFPSDARQIDPRPVEVVAIDPAGRNLAYVTRRSPTSPQFDLNILNLASGKTRTFPETQTRQWSPDGKRLLCAKWRRAKDSADLPGFVYFWLNEDGSQTALPQQLAWGWVQLSPQGDVVGMARPRRSSENRRYQRYRVPAKRPWEAILEPNALNLGAGTYRAHYAPGGACVSISYSEDPKFFDVDLLQQGESRRFLSRAMLGDARLSPDGKWLLTLEYQPRTVATWLKESAMRLWKMVRREEPYAPFQVENPLCAKLAAYRVRDRRRVELAELGGAGTLIAYYKDVETFYPQFLACGLTSGNTEAIFLWDDRLYRVPVKENLR